MSEIRWTAGSATAMLADMDFEQRYRAVATRDVRFDGSFVLGVRTTGIYCRPSCPARTPKASNVEFFTTGAAAHESGYRACKRCLPDAVPGSPEWNLRSDVAARAMRLIADGVVEREGVVGLAARLGYTTRHLGRLLGTELGAGPLALARAHRAQTARHLLVGTDLPISEVAFAAGFGSIRQFNETISAVYDRTPSALRATRREHVASETSAGLQIRLALPVRLPYDAAGVFNWLAVRAVPGVEVGDSTYYRRTLLLPDGPAVFEVRWIDQRLELSAELTSLRGLTPLLARVRRLFDADADPAGIDRTLAAIPELAASVAQTPGIRLPGAVDPQELLFRALFGQQISVAAARTQLGRLAQACGTAVAPPTKPVHLLFPSAAQIWEQGGSVLRGPAARIRSILGVAEGLANGDLQLSWADDPGEQRQRLLALPGVGPWTAGYVAMRVLGHPDILLTSDLALRAGAANLGLPTTPESLARWGEQIAPWRSYASLHLWRAAASTHPIGN